jgi:hypothetical protein
MDITKDITPADNMRLASCGVKCLNSSSVFQINFSAGLTILCPEIPHERQAQKRCPKCERSEHFGQRKTDLRREALASLALRTTTDLRPLLSQRRKSVFRWLQV